MSFEKVFKDITKEVTETASKVGRRLAESEGPQINNWMVKTLPKETRSFSEDLFPFRFTALGTTAVVGGSLGYDAFTTASNERAAKNFRYIDAQRLANTVGHTPLTVDPEIVRQIPSDLRTSGFNKTVDAIPGIQGKRHDDMGAGGDLVLAMHKLR